MAIVYVDSNATGSNNGTNWGNAYTTLQAGLTAWTTSDILWVAHNHSETFASSNTLTSVNSGRLHPCVLYRVNSGTDLYDPSPLDGTDTAQIIGTTTSQPLTFNFSGSWFGFSFEWGDYVKVNPSLECYFEDCDISYGIQTSTFAYLDLSDVTGATFKNCLIKNIWGADSYIVTQSAGNVLFIGCEFNVNDKQIGNIRLLEEENIIDDRKVKLGDIFTKEKIRIQYEYDFGDCWEHIIELEKILPKEKNKKYPVCTDGERNCPHEDCGGVDGYYEYVKIIKNKNHPEYKEMMQWLGSGKFDLEYFNIKEKNKELRDLENYIKGYKD